MEGFAVVQALYGLVASGSFCWFLASSLWIYPHSLSYFNESIGGPLNGPEHLLGSSVDWGQDLKYIIWSMDLKEFGTEPENRRLAFEALYNPQDLGFPESYSVTEEQFESLVIGVDGQEVKSSLRVLPPATYWLSANFERGIKGNVRLAYDANYPPVDQTAVNGLLQYSRLITYSIRKVIVD